MHPPDELMVQSFLPAMRQLVATQLRYQGLSQSKISAMLGLTQASVSLYLSSGPKKAYATLAALSIPHSEADQYSSALAAAVKRSAVEGVGTLNAIWMGLLGSGTICPAHRAMHPTLADCDMCIREYGQRKGGRSQAITEVREAVKMLESSSKFAAVIPEVSVNIACATENAASPADVVAVPGRIVKVRDRAKAMLPPEAGASIHMSRILLLVRKSRPDIRACMNLRYDDRMGTLLRRSGLRTLSIGNYVRAGAEDPTVEALERKLKSKPPPFGAIIDEGGSAIEPNVYLFDKGAREVAELALELARAYSAA